MDKKLAEDILDLTGEYTYGDLRRAYTQVMGEIRGNESTADVDTLAQETDEAFETLKALFADNMGGTATATPRANASAEKGASSTIGTGEGTNAPGQAATGTTTSVTASPESNAKPVKKKRTGLIVAIVIILLILGPGFGLAYTSGLMGKLVSGESLLPEKTEVMDPDPIIGTWELFDIRNSDGTSERFNPDGEQEYPGQSRFAIEWEDWSTLFFDANGNGDMDPDEGYCEGARITFTENGSCAFTKGLTGANAAQGDWANVTDQVLEETGMTMEDALAQNDRADYVQYYVIDGLDARVTYHELGQLTSPSLYMEFSDGSYYYLDPAS